MNKFNLDDVVTVKWATYEDDPEFETCTVIGMYLCPQYNKLKYILKDSEGKKTETFEYQMSKG